MIVTNVKDEHVLGLKLNDEIVVDKNVIGSFVKNTGELTILNINHTYDDLLNTFIEIQDFGTWYVESIKTDEESISSTLSIYDIAHKFDEDYEDTFPFPNTLGAWGSWIGEKVGVPLSGDFLNSDLTLSSRPYLGDKPKWRDAVKQIAKYASSYVQKNYDNTYSIKWFDDTLYDIEDWESFKHGNKTKEINVIVLSTGSTEDNVKWPETIPNEPCELKIEDDWLNIDRYSINEAIYNQVNGFSYTPISKLNIPYGLLKLRAGQKIRTQDIEDNDIETYITKNTLEWQGGDFTDSNAWTSSIYMEELKETSTKLEYANSFQNRLLNVERKTDKNNGLIEDLIEETSEYDKRITQNTQDINGISEKVSGTYDFSRKAYGNNELLVEEAQAGSLIEFHISGEMELNSINDDNYLSSNNNLLDSYLIIEGYDGSKNRIKLPIEYLYKVENTSDEFVLERKYNEDSRRNESKIKIIRRIVVDSSGSKKIATKETIEELGILEIPLFKGTNKIYLESFQDISYSVKYAIINDITEKFEDTYATKVEMQTEISRTEKDITLSVNKTLENYSTTEEMNVAIKLSENLMSSIVSEKVGKDEIISTINQSAEKVKVNANKVDLEGYVTITDLETEGATTINGANITTGEINCDLLSGGTIKGQTISGGEVSGAKLSGSSGEIGGFDINKTRLLCNITPKYDYSESDQTRLQQILAGEISMTSADLEKYDFNGDGILNSADLLRCRQAILCGISKSSPGKMIFDTTDWFAPIKILNSSNKMVSSFGPTGAYTYYNE